MKITGTEFWRVKLQPNYFPTYFIILRRQTLTSFSKASFANKHERLKSCVGIVLGEKRRQDLAKRIQVLLLTHLLLIKRPLTSPTARLSIYQSVYYYYYFNYIYISINIMRTYFTHFHSGASAEWRFLHGTSSFPATSWTRANWK